MVETKLMTRGELATMMGVTKRTVDLWRQFDGLPFYKNGNFVRFNPQDIEKWMEQFRKNTE